MTGQLIEEINTLAATTVETNLQFIAFRLSMV
jgi:hypothetical protein